MERGSSKHGPALDEEMKREVNPIEQGSPAGARVEEGRDPEGWATASLRPMLVSTRGRPSAVPTSRGT